MELSTLSLERLAPGRHYPLGASLAKDGVNFAVFSKHAREVYLLLFDAIDTEPTDIIRIEHCNRFVWHIFIFGITPGQRYAYKVLGEYDPARGLRFNEHKLLIDPYARAVTGKHTNIDNVLCSYDPLSAERDLAMDTRDNTAIVPKGIIVNDDFDWQGDGPPDIALQDLIIYEVHLKGFTAHPSSGVSLPGTYLGFIEKIPYLKTLGINAVELLPLHEFYVDDFLKDRALTNYWGYNSFGFFTPESSYAAGTKPGCQVAEFKTLVRELHKAGIEVILDVVYNHTGEGNELGPTLSFRGFDNPTYYCLTGKNDEPLRRYKNYSGCGNAMHLGDQHCMRLVMDSLRYWVEVMHVDGFRFDLAAALGREQDRFEKSSSFFDAISQDPVLCRVKMIAEPWDIETYKVGDFPVYWSEWNGKYRDTLRKSMRGDALMAQDLGFRLTGSADLFGDDGRQPHNSINFITCHDGFTLHDLVSYNEKHNEANGEKNRDGSNQNYSWNCGFEGETNDPSVLQLRRQLIKNHLCCLFFSLGTPMLLGGDEFMRTQQGNNNAYCQDNEISWFDWTLLERNRDIFDFCRQAIAFRHQFPILKRERFLLGTDTNGNSIPDISWFGLDLQPPDWHNQELRTLCYMLDGTESRPIPGNYLLFIIINSAKDAVSVRLPAAKNNQWHRVVDTSLAAGEDFLTEPGKPIAQQNSVYTAAACSVVVLVGK